MTKKERVKQAKGLIEQWNSASARVEWMYDNALSANYAKFIGRMTQLIMEAECLLEGTDYEVIDE